MGRNATINIKNETGYELIFVSSNLEHGKFNQDPPTTILNSSTSTFKVGNHTGAKIGPKGSVTYRLNLTKFSSIELIFYWDHPFGHTSSSYEMGSNPDWFSSYYLDPPNPTGHDQTLTFVTRLNDYGFDQKSWMSKLKEETNLRDVLLPGSHDSGTYDISSSSNLCLDSDNQIMVFASNVGIASQWAKAQSNSILDQLKQGIRYLDFRISNGYYNGLVIKNLSIDNVTGDPVICHSVGITPPSKILDDIATFIKAYPKEILVLNFQHFYHKEEDATSFYQKLINDLSEKFETKMVDRSTIESLTLKNLWDNNKQVVVMFDQDHTVTKTLSPEGGKKFSDKYNSLYDNNKFIWSSSVFLSNEWTNSASIEKLKVELQNIIDKNIPGKDKLFVLQGVVTPDSKTYLNAVDGGLPKSLEELGNEVTPNVESWVINDWVDKNLNIIMCDYLSNSILTQLCFIINKKKNHL
jgi:hypothetical protein